jgi:hypothetical protein
MLITKLKVGVAAAVLVVLVGAGGFAFRAAGQAPEPVRRADTRPLTELELLRREVDILKLQVEVMQEKLRAQEAELHALKAPAGLPTRTATVTTSQVAGQPTVTSRTEGVRAQEGQPDASQFRPYIAVERAPDKPGTPAATSQNRAAAGPEQEVEAALKALHEATDDAGMRRALEAMDRAVQRLKERAKSQAPATSPRAK